MLLGAQAQTFLNMADVVTAAENFPDHRGTVNGIVKGFLGLSGAILVQRSSAVQQEVPFCLLSHGHYYCWVPEVFSVGAQKTE
ncbi:hypothetical protein ACQJBY_039663 [Aegilops geniculata]